MLFRAMAGAPGQLREVQVSVNNSGLACR